MFRFFKSVKPIAISAVMLTCLGSASWADGGLVTRTELHRVPAGVDSTHEVIVSRLEVQPGGTIPRHSHLGIELLTVVSGGQMQAGTGQVIDFPTGAVVQFPEGAVHGGLTNIADTPLVAITTHVVDVGEALNQLVTD